MLLKFGILYLSALDSKSGDVFNAFVVVLYYLVGQLLKSSGVVLSYQDLLSSLIFSTVFDWH